MICASCGENLPDNATFCKACGAKIRCFESTTNRSERDQNELQTRIARVDMITSAGDIKESYATLGVGFASYSAKGAFDYTAALSKLTKFAQQNGADGVIYVSFNERSALGKEGCFGNDTVQIFEVRCWGTMIKRLA